MQADFSDLLARDVHDGIFLEDIIRCGKGSMTQDEMEEIIRRCTSTIAALNLSSTSTSSQMYGSWRESHTLLRVFTALNVLLHPGVESKQLSAQKLTMCRLVASARLIMISCQNVMVHATAEVFALAKTCETPKDSNKDVAITAPLDARRSLLRQVVWLLFHLSASNDVETTSLVFLGYTLCTSLVTVVAQHVHWGEQVAADACCTLLNLMMTEPGTFADVVVNCASVCLGDGDAAQGDDTVKTKPAPVALIDYVGALFHDITSDAIMLSQDDKLPASAHASIDAPAWSSLQIVMMQLCSSALLLGLTSSIGVMEVCMNGLVRQDGLRRGVVLQMIRGLACALEEAALQSVNSDDTEMMSATGEDDATEAIAQSQLGQKESVEFMRELLDSEVLEAMRNRLQDMVTFDGCICDDENTAGGGAGVGAGTAVRDDMPCHKKDDEEQRNIIESAHHLLQVIADCHEIAYGGDAVTCD
jgi:hypothetical protein